MFLRREPCSLQLPSLHQLEDTGSHQGLHGNGYQQLNELRAQQENHFLSNFMTSYYQASAELHTAEGFFPNQRASLGAWEPSCMISFSYFSTKSFIFLMG